ncbi:MAG TPA: 4'-phosphopantetheinyl transferase superfamily protein [Jiangellales bacterium]|nr:4'-phosphopantetheinyl transferase superfamily protein [Jiangellales bacterium]
MDRIPDWTAELDTPVPEPQAATGPLRWTARGEHELPTTDAWLAPAESARAAGMRFTKRRTEYLLRRWAGKQAVAAAAGLPTDVGGLARIEVANRPGGAPYVVVGGAPLRLDVSLTDRAGWAVCVVGADLSRVGCDLELVEPRSAAFVADFLTAGEQEYVAACPSHQRDAVVNLVWSAKESALKVLRTGLRRDTRSVDVLLGRDDDIDAAGALADAGTGWHPLTVRPAEGGALPGWWRRDGAFLLTVAADRPLPVPEVLRGSADLTRADPRHSWVDRPLAP